MRHRCAYALTSLAVVLLLVFSTGSVSADGIETTTDWSKWQPYFMPVIPAEPNNPANLAGRPIPPKSPSDAQPMVSENMHNLAPLPVLAAHAEEIARGSDQSMSSEYGPADGEPDSVNAWARGGVLRTDKNPGPFFEAFNDWYGETRQMTPHQWGAYAYTGADNVTIDREQIHKNEPPTDGTYSLNIAASVPFEAGVSRTIRVKPGSQVTVRVMSRLYNLGGPRGGDLTYDWISMGVKVDDYEATWVNGYWHGQWLPLEQTVTAGKDGRIMIFLQVQSRTAENVNGYFDNVQVWVDGEPFTG